MLEELKQQAVMQGSNSADMSHGHGHQSRSVSLLYDLKRVKHDSAA